MKIIKSFFQVILTTILVMLIVMLTTSILVKNIIQKQLVSSIIKEEFITEISRNGEVSANDEFLKSVNDGELENVVNEVFSEYIMAINDEDYEVKDETVDHIIDYFINHKEQIESLTGEDVDIEEIKSQEFHDEFKKEFNESLSEFNTETSGDIKDYIKLYNFLTSTNFKVMLGVAIVAIILLLGLIKSNIIKALGNVGVPLAINGIITCGIFVLIKYFINLKEFNIDKEFTNIIKLMNFNIILYVGLIELTLGVVLCVVKTILLKKKSNNERIESTEFNDSSVI